MRKFPQLNLLLPMRRCAVVFSLLAAFGAMPAVGAQNSVEERLQALEERVRQLADENRELKKQLGFRPESAPVFVQPAGKATRLAVGGFLQGQAEFGGVPDPRWAGTTSHDRFFFRRARIYVTGAFAENFDFKAELELQGNTLSGGTGHSARANEIYVNWRKYPQANVRFGQLKPAFGAEQLASDTKLLTIERYLGSDRLTEGRQLAVAVLGDVMAGKLSYLLVAANGNGANVSGNDDNHFQRSARVAFTPWAATGRRLTLGVNGLWTEDTAVPRAGLGFTGNTFAGQREGAGIDAALTWGWLELSAEWLRMEYRPVDAVPDVQFDAEAWHATAAVRLVPDRLQAVVRREWFDPNSRRAGDVVETWLLGFNYHLKGDDLKLQVNYLLGDNPGAARDGRLLTRVQVMF